MRKASLSLSINAIVILVLALTMLGIGISFTKSMFAKAGDKLIGVDYTEVPNPNRNEIITGLSSVPAEPGGEAVIPFKVYNNDPNNDITITTTTKCKPSEYIDTKGDIGGIQDVQDSDGISIPVKGIGEFSILVPLKGSDNGVVPGKIILCNVVVQTGTGSSTKSLGSKTVKIKVK